MISVRLWTGQTLEFPDGTSQEVMRQAAERVLAGARDTSTGESVGGRGMNLSHLRDQPEPGTAYDLLSSSAQRPIQGPPRPVQGPPDFREWQPDPNSPMRERRHTGEGWEFRPRAGAMGTAIPAVGRVEGGTPEKSRLRKTLEGSEIEGVRELANLYTLPEAIKVAGTVALETNVQMGRLPSVVAGLVTQNNPGPHEIISQEKIRQGLANPQERLLASVAADQRQYQRDKIDPLRPVVEAVGQWRENATEELAREAQDLPESEAARIFWGAAGAGLAADASNLIGGAVAKPFGTAGGAMTELEQRIAARSGKYASGVEEPLIYLDDRSFNGSPGWKGKIPDTFRDLTGKPWREYGPDHIPLDRPSSIPPRPRSVERDPLPLPPLHPRMYGTDEDIARIAGLWDYASRRYPTITSRVKRMELGPPTGGSYFEPETGTLSLSVNADLGTLMHELGHVAQEARGKLARPAELEARGLATEAAQLAEPHSTRLGDVYSRAQQPSPKRTGSPELVPYEVQYGIKDGWGTTWNEDLQAWELHVPGKKVRYFQGEDNYAVLMETLKDEYIKGHPRLQRLEYQGHEYFGQPGDLPPRDILEATYPWTEEELIYKNKLKEAGKILRQAAFGEEPISGGPALSGGEVRDLPDITLDVDGGNYRVEIPGEGSRGVSDLPDLGRTQPTGLTNVFHQNPSAEMRAKFPDAIIDSRDAYPGPVYTGPERRARPFQASESGPGSRIARNPEVLAPEPRTYTGLDHINGDMPPELAAPPDYTVTRLPGDGGIQVDTPAGGTRFFRNPKEASLWLDAENDRLLDAELPGIYDRAGDRLDRIAVDSDLHYENQNAYRHEMEYRTETAGILEEELGRRPTRAEVDSAIDRELIASGNEPVYGSTAEQTLVNDEVRESIAGAYMDSMPGQSILDTAIESIDDYLVRGETHSPDGAPWQAVRSELERYRLAGVSPKLNRDGTLEMPIIPTEATQAARLEAAEREAFLRDPLPPNPRERGSVGAPPDPTAPAPPPFQAKLPEEYVAERLGWKVPDGSPRVTQPVDTLTTPDFQTNLAAQVGGPEAGYFGDPEIAGYVLERSDEVYKAIGPPQSWDTLEEMATRLGTTKEEFLSRPSHWNVLPPEARLRLTYVIKGNEQDIANLQSKLAAGTATDADKAELLRHINTREDLIKLGAQTGSAYGRALNSLKIEARLALGDDVLLRQKLYREYSKQLDAEKPLMETLARLDPNNPEELQAFLRVVNKPKWYEYAQEYWVSSILSGLATHERNLIGNAVNAVLENAVVRPVSAGFDAARVAGTGADRAIYLRETHEAMKGLAKGAYKASLKPFVDETRQAVAAVGLTRGLRQGIRKGFEVLKRGYDPLTMQGKLLPVRSAFARSQNRVVREVVGPIVTAPLRLLQVSDTLFKTMNHTAEIYAQAARAASREGLSGDAFAARVAHLVGNPTDEMIDAADAFALKATFNDEASAIGKAVMGLRDLPGASSTNPGIQLGIETYRAGMGFILPFVKIADRLMVRGFEYTPLGIPMAVGARRAGNFAEAADLAARSSIGSVVLAYAASLAMEGRLTAGAPTDEGEKAAFYGAQKQPWSVRTDDGVWIPYGGLQPIGTPFALAASFWKGWQENDEAPDIEKLGHAAQQIGVYVTDQSYMDGLSKFMDAIGGSDTQSGRAFSDLATNTAWGFAPYAGLTRSIAKGVDPRVIDAETIGQRLKQNVPGVSLSMDARLTPWGEDVVPVGGRLRSVLAPGSILLPSQERPNPLDQELDRLGMPLGYVGQSIADKFGEGRSRGTWKLNQSEWYLYQQTAGRASKLLLERLYAKPGYPEWDIEHQREETQKAIEAARKYARIVMVRYHRGQGIPGMNPRLGDINAAVNPRPY